MASYVNRKERAFHVGTIIIPHIRSEAKMKLYESSTDSRAWCDFVEQRRHHIMEYLARSKAPFCLEHLIPAEMLFFMIMSQRNDEREKLYERKAYLEGLLNIYANVNYNQEQRSQLDKMLAKIRGLE